MKRSTITMTAILFILTLGLSAVSRAETHPRFGLAGGLNIAKVWGNEAGGTGTHSGGIGGILMYFPMGNTAAFRPEFIFSQKGTEADFYDPYSDSYQRVVGAIDYVEIPLLFDVSFTSSPGSHPYIIMGPALAVPIKAQIKFGDQAVDVSNVRNLDFGFIGGLGIAFGGKERHFMIETRYNLGLNQIFDDRTLDQAVQDVAQGELPVVWPDTGRGLQYKNAVLSFMVGVMF